MINPESAQYRELAEPNAASLVESLRAVGYSLQTAIADLADNSLTAGANRVEVKFCWAGEDSAVSIIDNGRGMDRAQLIDALRPGASNPLEPRDSRDLGRFGLGLKTASFSQCRRLTVHSKTQAGEETQRTWDLNHVGRTNEWRLIEVSDPVVSEMVTELAKFKSGTVVVWQGCDRIVPPGTSPDDEKAQRRFLESASRVIEHLALVFHRFMEGIPPIKFHVNGNPVKPFDPFLTTEKATQQLTEETLKLRGQSIVIRPFVLPHHSKMTKEAYERAAGPRGWTQSQGFYIYRNKRLLVDGEWLLPGLRKDDHYKLARIQIDIPNTLDSEWQIDVRKARATPPTVLRDRLMQIAQLSRTNASNIYRHRGARLRNSQDELVLLWDRRLSHGKAKYELNRAHPFIQRILDGSCCSPKNVESLLRLVEETVPVPTITIDAAERPDEQREPFQNTDSAELIELARQLVRSLILSGSSSSDAISRLSAVEPFHRLPHIIEAMREELD